LILVYEPKIKKMKNIVFICAILCSLSQTAQSTVTKNLGDYTVLKVYNGIALEMLKSTEAKLVITGKKSEKVNIKNVNGTLKIALPFSVNLAERSAEGDVLVTLYYKSDIAIVDANEGATITAKKIQQDKLEVNVQEGAFINLVIEVEDLEVRASSGGIIKLTGTAKNQTVDVDLYGVYNGFGLKAALSSTVQAGTGAKAEIMAGETLKAKVNFGGSIFYKGNPEVTKDKKIIGGTIQKRD
jgi:hypothetical protein